MARLSGPCGIAAHHLVPGKHLVRVKTVFTTVIGTVTEVPGEENNGVPVVVYDLGRGDSRWARLSQVLDVLHADPEACGSSCERACAKARAEYPDR